MSIETLAVFGEAFGQFDGFIIQRIINEFLFEGKSYSIPIVMTDKCSYFVYAPVLLEMLFGPTRGGDIVQRIKSFYWKINMKGYPKNWHMKLNVQEHYKDFTPLEVTRIHKFIPYHRFVFKPCN